jgi:mannose-6-phosphate isomerase-like protein (cupin superfamily)
VSEPVLIPPGGGEVVADSPERRVEILSDDAGLNATWSRFEAGREGAGLHIHRRHTDLFYVLEGELTVRLGVEDRLAIVSPGTLARVPPFVVHGFRNAGEVEVRYLNFHAPGGDFADYMRDLRDGREASFDVDEPDAEGVLPSTEAVVGGEEVVVDRPGLRVARLTEVEAIAITETAADPGTLATDHLHPDHLASLYVLEGELSLAVGDRELQVTVGTWAQVPPDTPYTLAFPAAEPVRFLSVRTPRATG